MWDGRGQLVHLRPCTDGNCRSVVFALTAPRMILTYIPGKMGALLWHERAYALQRRFASCARGRSFGAGPSLRARQRRSSPSECISRHVDGTTAATGCPAIFSTCICCTGAETYVFRNLERKRFGGVCGSRAVSIRLAGRVACRHCCEDWNTVGSGRQGRGSWDRHTACRRKIEE